ncbi:hypothetical protein ACGFX4_16865 [Kitasatospora sp. NPDC048365]|uniref:hypothetical protein n=1 Tax=Kitasatospora sp. NPDC048365 TaxID=3364050 RepID=UPI00371C860B
MDEHRTTSNRRRAAVMAGALLAAGVLTACGSGSGGSASSAGASVSGSPSSSAPSSPAPGSPSASASPAPSASASQPTPQPTTPGIAVGEPDPTAVKIPATGYRLQSPTSITVFFEAGICDKYGLKVEEDTPPILKVRVVITQTAPRGQACPQVIKEQSVTATLTKPVKSGAVVDLATGQQLSPNVTEPAGGPR